ncbi:nicotinamide-nucleotide adenylyltransferase [Candidatus Bathyarchaeota archaeon]|nr:MAG: nicotinamide-nucleotide adenylyltransferase [Candidatus Bathyarchaeota archaeon]
MVGRFQPIHKGHLKAMLDILSEFEELVVVVGSAQLSHELDNPFTVGERLVMVRLALSEAGVEPGRYWLIPVPDAPAHSVWVAMVLAYCPKFEVVYSNEPLTRRLFQEAGFEVRSIPFYERHIYSATEVRRRILAGEPWEDLVPSSVADFIKAIGGVERLRALARTDKPVGR